MAPPTKPQSRSRPPRGPDAHQNQHLVPRQHFQTEPHRLVELFKLSPGWQQEFDFERDRYNLQRLPEYASGGNEQRSSVHRGAHPSINDIMEQRLTDIYNSLPSELRNQAEAGDAQARQQLKLIIGQALKG